MLTRARVARDLCAEAAAQSGALELEQWTSLLLGQIWVRSRLAPACSGDPILAVGTPVLESFADVGGTPARIALAALGRLDRGGLGRAASRLAGAMEDPLPSWITEVGAASVVRALADRSPGDGEAFLLESDPVNGTAHMLAVFVASRLGGIAKHLGLTRVLGQPDFEREAEAATRRSSGFRPVDPGLACAQVREAIKLTDAAPDPAVGESFAPLRALTLARVDHSGAVASGALAR